MPEERGHELPADHRHLLARRVCPMARGITMRRRKRTGGREAPVDGVALATLLGRPQLGGVSRAEGRPAASSP